MQGKARAVALIAVLPVVLDKDFRTRAGNGWFMTETSLDLRSVQYGLDDLREAGLIEVEVRGPRRTITAIIPPEDATEKHERSVHATRASEGEQIVHAKPASKREQSKWKARTDCSRIEGRSPPYPPKSSLSEFQRSRRIAAKNDTEPWQRGTVPGWASDGDPHAVDADAGGASRAAPQASSGSKQGAAR
jgi:hypothetical protein